MIAYLPLVRRLIHQKWWKKVSTTDLDDLVQAGTIGLMQAARRFDPSHGVKFATYAGTRIVGAAIDHIRTIMGRPDRGRPRVRPVLETDLERPGDDERPLHRIAGGADPETEHQVARVRAAVQDRLARLYPIRVVRMAMMHVFDRRSLRVVGHAFGVSESRASQIMGPLRERVRQVIQEEVAGEVAG